MLLNSKFITLIYLYNHLLNSHITILQYIYSLSGGHWLYLFICILMQEEFFNKIKWFKLLIDFFLKIFLIFNLKSTMKAFFNDYLKTMHLFKIQWFIKFQIFWNIYFCFIIFCFLLFAFCFFYFIILLFLFLKFNQHKIF